MSALPRIQFRHTPRGPELLIDGFLMRGVQDLMIHHGVKDIATVEVRFVTDRLSAGDSDAEVRAEQQAVMAELRASDSLTLWKPQAHSMACANCGTGALEHLGAADEMVCP